MGETDQCVPSTPTDETGPNFSGASLGVQSPQAQQFPYAPNRPSFIAYSPSAHHYPHLLRQLRRPVQQGPPSPIEVDQRVPSCILSSQNSTEVNFPSRDRDPASSADTHTTDSAGSDPPSESRRVVEEVVSRPSSRAEQGDNSNTDQSSESGNGNSEAIVISDDSE
ncbi:hypothetical protein BIW11_05426 [Tropilaelaps mercedesae]|uniref:Uncharacterized protein n=1 Tax=Tropilaelaps mercedesae TaxID=418985 RepID=A0A1V9Y2E7_9ACAR|nr:hypothetical protein BIW11_05426 [Tropilaelaps mercedesae]